MLPAKVAKKQMEYHCILVPGNWPFIEEIIIAIYYFAQFCIIISAEFTLYNSSAYCQVIFDWYDL